MQTSVDVRTGVGWSPYKSDALKKCPRLVSDLALFGTLMIEVVILFLRIGEAAFKTLCYEMVGILVTHVPFDGEMERMIVYAGHKLRVSFGTKEDWTREAMEAGLRGILCGKGMGGRFEIGALVLGNADVSIEVDGMWKKFDKESLKSFVDEIEKVTMQVLCGNKKLDEVKSVAFREIQLAVSTAGRLTQASRPAIENPKTHRTQVSQTTTLEKKGKRVLETSELSGTKPKVDLGKTNDEPKVTRKKAQTTQEFTRVKTGKKEEVVYSGKAGKLDSVTCGKKTHGIDSEEGSAYGFEWKKFRNGVKLLCETLVAIHLLHPNEEDVTRHGFPDMMGKLVPSQVDDGVDLEVWKDGELRKVTTRGKILVKSRFGKRTIWGLVPKFHFDGLLASGSPIFMRGKLVSVVTKSDGNGNYAVSGISSASGHFRSHRVRIRRMESGTSVYGKLIGTYEEIKLEATREKKEEKGGTNYEIVVGENTVRIIGWNGDNNELFHTRIGEQAYISEDMPED